MRDRRRRIKAASPKPVQQAISIGLTKEFGLYSCLVDKQVFDVPQEEKNDSECSSSTRDFSTVKK